MATAQLLGGFITSIEKMTLIELTTIYIYEDFVMNLPADQKGNKSVHDKIWMDAEKMAQQLYNEPDVKAELEESGADSVEAAEKGISTVVQGTTELLDGWIPYAAAAESGIFNVVGDLDETAGAVLSTVTATETAETKGVEALAIFKMRANDRLKKAAVKRIAREAVEKHKAQQKQAQQELLNNVKTSKAMASAPIMSNTEENARTQALAGHIQRTAPLYAKLAAATPPATSTTTKPGGGGNGIVQNKQSNHIETLKDKLYNHFLNLDTNAKHLFQQHIALAIHSKCGNLLKPNPQGSSGNSQVNLINKQQNEQQIKDNLKEKIPDLIKCAKTATSSSLKQIIIGALHNSMKKFKKNKKNIKKNKKK